jgi:hypothetical protein
LDLRAVELAGVAICLDPLLNDWACHDEISEANGSFFQTRIVAKLPFNFFFRSPSAREGVVKNVKSTEVSYTPHRDLEG